MNSKVSIRYNLLLENNGYVIIYTWNTLSTIARTIGTDLKNK